jgi:hydroxyacyl-ACP dehydratase HTD2-like protein with hotdog domain
MKKQLGMVLTSLIFVIGFSAIANAQEWRRNHNINAREARQERRIYHGIASGELTQREALRLDREEDRVDRIKARYRRTGDGLSPRERARLERDLNHVSRDIYRQKHDGQTRWRP